MVVFTAKVTKTKMVVFALLIIAAIALLFFGLSHNTKADKVNTAASGISERKNFLAQFGWKINEKTEKMQDITIPSAFDSVYAPYNKLQKAQGFDLTKYKNKPVKSYTYAVLNYPDKPTGIYATLLVYNNKVIGGDVHSAALDGFMHGFNLTNTGLSYGQYTPIK